MPKGPAGGPRITSLGPFSYDEKKPPALPDSFEPPSIVANSLGQEDIQKDWGQKPRPAKELQDDLGGPSELRPDWAHGITGAYSHIDDAVVVDNREWIHHPDQTEFVSRGVSPISEWWGADKEDKPMVWAAGFGWFGDEEYIPFADIDKTDVMLDRLTLKHEDVEVEWIYKAVYACRLLDIPEETEVTVRHGIRGLAVAERRVMMGDLYRELEFGGYLPEPLYGRGGDVK